MNPISRLRTRARSLAGRSATAWPCSQYSPLVAESSRPRIDRSVDLPHPEGPAMDTYSPLATSRLTSDRACVSTSSVRNTLATDFNLMTLVPLVDVMMASLLPTASYVVSGFSRTSLTAWIRLKADTTYEHRGY